MRFAVLAVILCLPAGPEPRTSAQTTAAQSTDVKAETTNREESDPSVQFDAKGVEFGPWVRRFVGQVRRNWNVPEVAMHAKGRVVITFYVHKDGALTDITVVRPCPIEPFNSAAAGALVWSNPTEPLPPQYPADKAFFTVTFFYNDRPPEGGEDTAPTPPPPGPPAPPAPPATWPPAGVYRSDSEGVTPPRLTYRVEPHYTAAAIRERIEGTVLLEGIVQFDGSVASVRVVRSLDAKFGLDLEAIKAATRWHFAPGRRGNEIVPIIVPMEIAFTLPK